MNSSLRRATVPDDYPRLVEVWRSAVDATHDFLASADRTAIEAELIPSYFPNVTLHVVEQNGRIVGFSGVAGTMLEMLFVDAGARGAGVGTTLLHHAVSRLGVTLVDVNEQNDHAVGFYLHQGFSVTGRSEFDGDGRPYPLLHLSTAP
ncbi:acetyltransferase [Corynebacterium sp. USCH3]|uniref:acetyltransferase n=1 Tax=Corynebacterium sp. USCH3 TaxID=3024840 RepID=UPI00309735F1